MDGNQSTARARLGRGGRPFAGALLLLATAASWSGAQEPPACLSPYPLWPAPSKPYFMVIADTSGSMSLSVAASNTCGLPNDRLGHLRCALRQVFRTYEGAAHFGLATFAAYQSSCSGACYTGCQHSAFEQEVLTTGYAYGCGPIVDGTRRGANIVVPLRQDNFWTLPAVPSNETDLLSWVDDACGDNSELFAFATGRSPLNGALRDMYLYLSGSWVRPDLSVGYVSPLSLQDRPCRPVHVILIMGGDESCGSSVDAIAAAGALYAGVTAEGITWKVQVDVVNLGADATFANSLAAAGGTGTARPAANETELLVALRAIITPTLAGETCDNQDDNCNGCTDEGHRHFGNVGQTCCAWATPGQRETCLDNYRATITPANPQGDRTMLPCTTAAQATDPGLWLCNDPGEVCDSIDNNVDGLTDEGMTKCGSPAHCPQTEACNGQDDDCDGGVDEGGVCGSCVWSPEVCDGCDNDCDGVADDGVAAVPCGLVSPPNCAGFMPCKAQQAVALPGGCAAGGGWNACANNPQTETCDGIDNDCDGIVDDGIASVACVPAGTPGGLVYGGPSQCRRGQRVCGGSCTGFVGPTAEVCDGVDNNCNGQVDEAAAGVGAACGVNQAPCTPGVTVCVAGGLVCQGGVGPGAEVCDGIDNDCDGAVDDLPLADAPPPGQNGCWSLPGNCCSFHGLTWCPPSGATCTDSGALSPPCHRGTLVCTGGSWRCNTWKEPSAESCNGIDDDCNGLVDDGASLCPAGRSCQDGACR